MPDPRPLVLIAEDDPLTLDGFAGWLAEAGFEVLTAANGDDALRLALERQPLVAVLDITMSGLSGIEVARRLDERTDVGYLFVTGASEPAVVSEASPGALGYVVKPIDKPQLQSAVRSAAVRARGSRELRAAERRVAQELAQSRSIHLATGILMERDWVSAEEALVRLSQRARDAALPLIAAAHQVIDEVAQKAR